MVLRLFLGSHGTLVTVSAPFMMPLRDSDIPMNVPSAFCNKQPLAHTHRTVFELEFQVPAACDLPASALVRGVDPRLGFARLFFLK